MDFTGKSVLITGSSRGIGKATASAFVQRGARVAINGRTHESTIAAIAELRAAGQAVAAAGDVRTVGGCEAIVQSAVDGLGGLDVLVNTAGVWFDVSLEDSDEDIWDRTIDTNLKGTFFCSRGALTALRASKGVIVNVASDAGLLGERGMAVYCASKGGVVNLTRAMALDLAPDVRVNCVCPGYVDTDMVRRDYIEKAADPAAAEEQLKASTPMQRMADADEIAKAIISLASSDAGFVTGAALQIDGGTTAGH
jgi:NAD(P)-dependent dehydrogenase (short-subunit alcohol dehydrogenase family)